MAGKGSSTALQTVASRGGRPAHQRDERAARQVEAMTGYGIPVTEIARVIGVCENTLRKYYGDEVAVGATKANAKVIESLFRKATGEGQGSVAAAIFWAKTRCGWKEMAVTEVSGPDGAPIDSGEAARNRITVLIQRFSDRSSEADAALNARQLRDAGDQPALTADTWKHR